MPFEIPPWIKTPNTGEQYARGMALGVQIAQQTQRIRAQQEAAAMDAAIKMQQIERQSEMERQRVAIADAYNQQRLDLERQQVEQAGAVNQMKTAQIAMQFAAQKEWQRRVIMNREDPATVAMELFPMLGLGAGDWGAAARSKAGGPTAGPVQAFPVIGPDGQPVEGTFATMGPSGMNVRNVPGYRPEGMSPGEKSSIASILQKRKEELAASIPPHKPKDPAGIKKWDDVQKELSIINDKINALYPWLTNQTMTVTAPPSFKVLRGTSGSLVPWSQRKQHEQYE